MPALFRWACVSGVATVSAQQGSAGGSGQNRRMTSPPAKPSAKPLTGPQKALRKLGLVRPIDLALHLPLRYEDETRLIK